MRISNLIAALSGVAAYFGVWVFAATPVTEPLETRAGIEQRAAAIDKVLRYDDLMNGHMRRGGILKKPLLWPFKPDDDEVEGAAELTGLIFAAQKRVPKCGLVSGDGSTLNPEQVKMLWEVADYMRRPDTQWSTPPARTILSALENISTC